MQSRSAEHGRGRELSDRPRPRAEARGAVWVGVVYLAWRATTLGWGAISLLSVPLFAVEVWGLLHLVALRHQATRQSAEAPPARSRRRAQLDVVITTADRSPEDLERTLIACRSLPRDRNVVVFDRWLRPPMATLASTHGVDYVTVGVAAMDDPGVIASDDRTGPVLWLEAGQVPMPDVDDAATWLEDPKVAVVQLGVGLLNADSLAHIDRGRDEHALERTVLAPALATRGLAPWTGPAAILRPDLIRSVTSRAAHEGAPLSVEGALIRLHADGLRTAFDARPLVRDTAPDSLGEYLHDRRARVRRTLEVLRTSENPLTGSAIPLRVRVTHLAMWSRIGEGMRLAILAMITTGVLLSGVLPSTAPVRLLVPLWLANTACAAVARHRIAAGTMAYGDWLRNGWRTLGADLAAMSDVISGRNRVEASPDDVVQGWASLGRLRLLTIAIVVLELAVVARGATLVWSDALPAFEAGERLVVLLFALGALVPMMDVLQLVVKRRQRRKVSRIRTVVPATVDGVATTTLDLAANGVGFTLPDASSVGDLVDVRLELARIDGTTSIVSAEGFVRSTTPLETGGHRVGIELGRMADRSRVDLISFCAVDHPYLERMHRAEADQLAPADFAVEGASSARVPVRVLTIAAVALGLTTAISGPAASADEARAPTVCVTDAAGQPSVGTTILVDDDGAFAELGVVGRDGCLLVDRKGTATFQVTVNEITRSVTQDLSDRPVVTFAGATMRIEIRSWDGTAQSDTAVRYWGDGWLDTSFDGDGDAVVVELLEGETGVELRLDGRRFIRTVTVDGDTDVVVRLTRLVADAELEHAVTEIDLGDGWRPFENGMEVLPGRLAIRQGDGTVTKLVVRSGAEVSLPSGQPS